MVSPYEYWQYWRNTEDGDVGRFLKLFTSASAHEIARLAALKGAELNEAKKVLATEATALVHGREAAEQAAETARQTFEQGDTSRNFAERVEFHATIFASRYRRVERLCACRARRLERRSAAAIPTAVEGQ